MKPQRPALLGDRPGDVGADGADRRAPANADSRAAGENAAERLRGAAGVVEHGGAPLLQEPQLVLQARRHQAFAADHVARLILAAQRLEGEAAYAAVAAGEEAKCGRKLAEVLGGGVAHLAAADDAVARAQGADDLAFEVAL